MIKINSHEKQFRISKLSIAWVPQNSPSTQNLPTVPGQVSGLFSGRNQSSDQKYERRQEHV